MKLYVLIDELTYQDIEDHIQSEIVLVTSKKKDVTEASKKVVADYDEKDYFGGKRGRGHHVYIDIWEDGKQLEKETIQVYKG